MKTWMFLPLSLLAACSFKGNLTPGFGSTATSSSSGGGGGGSSDQPYALRKVPELRGMTQAQAEAAMRSAGFDVRGWDNQDLICKYDDDRKMPPQGTICDQTPGAGTEATTRLPRVRIIIEKDTYAEGGLGTPIHWRRMPEVKGMTVAEATAALARANLPIGDHFVVSESTAEDCQPEGKICLVYPKAGARKSVVRKGRIIVGAKPPPGETPASTTPEPTTYF